MLQRRKRYKNRTILGYKTLAAGSIDMAEVPPGRADLATRALPPLFLRSSSLSLPTLSFIPLSFIKTSRLL